MATRVASSHVAAKIAMWLQYLLKFCGRREMVTWENMLLHVFDIYLNWRANSSVAAIFISIHGQMAAWLQNYLDEWKNATWLQNYENSRQNYGKIFEDIADNRETFLNWCEYLKLQLL